MSPVELLIRLRQQGVTFRVNGDKLSCDGPVEALTDDALAQLREAKPVLLAVLVGEQENEPIPSRPCRPNRTGDHRRFWLSTFRSWKCRECHPPGSPGLVLTEYELPGDVPESPRTGAKSAKENPMKSHPAAELFPMMSEAELRALVLDIQTHGLMRPIVTFEGMVLDGRNRLAACKEAGVEPRLEEWDGEGSPLAFVVSCNLHRRQLTQSQVAAVAVDALPLFEEEARERQGTSTVGQSGHLGAEVCHSEKSPTEGVPGDLGQGRARDHAARVFGVSSNYIEEARRLKVEDPEQFAAVKAGELTISKVQDIRHQIKKINELYESMISKTADGLRVGAGMGHRLLEIKAGVSDEDWPLVLQEHLNQSVQEAEIFVELANQEHLIDSRDFVILAHEEMLEALFERLDGGKDSSATDAWISGIGAALAKSA